MIALKTTGKQLESLIEDGSIKFYHIGVLIKSFEKIIFSIQQAEFLSLDNVQYQYDMKKNEIHLNGDITWNTELVFQCEILFYLKNNEIQSKLTAILPSEHLIHLPAVTWFDIRDTSFTLETIPYNAITDLYTSDYVGSMDCTLVLGDYNIPISAQLPTFNGMRLKADLKGLAIPNLNDLASFAGLDKESFHLPNTIEKLGELRLYAVILDIQSGIKGINRLSGIGIEFGVKESWELIPNLLFLNGIRVQIDVFDPASSYRSVGGFIEGDMTLGKVGFKISAGKYGANTPWIFKATIPKLELSDIIESVLKEFSFPTHIPKIELVDTEFRVTPSDGNFSFKTQTNSASEWEIPIGPKKLVLRNFGLDVSRVGGKLTGSIMGSADMFGLTFPLNSNLTDMFAIEAALTDVKISKIIEDLLHDLSLPSDLPDIVFDTLNFSIKPLKGEFEITAISTKDWHIPIGIDGLVIEDFAMTIQRQEVSLNKMVISGTLGGSLKIGSISLDIHYTFPGSFVLRSEIPKIHLSSIIQDICGAASFMDFPAPSHLTDMVIKDVVIFLDPKNKTFSISGKSDIGKVQLIIQQVSSGKWGFFVAYIPPSGWQFSSLDSSLKVLDDLNFNKSTFVLSSEKSDNLPLSIGSLPPGFSVPRGVTFVSGLNLAGLGAGNLLNKNTLPVLATISSDIAAIQLESEISGRIAVSEGIYFGDMKFILRPAPFSFDIGISGTLFVKLGQDDLKFIGTMSIHPIEHSASFSVTMIGDWKNPFGVRGVNISNLAVEVGIGIVPPPAVMAPIVGFAGSIRIGSFDGNAVVKFDAVTPAKSMLALSFDELHLNEVISTLCQKKIVEQIPKELKNTILSIGLNDVSAYVVPQPTRIGEILYEPGFKFQGKLSVKGFDAEFEFMLDYDRGLKITADIDVINIEHILIIKGSHGTEKPTIEIDLMLGGTPGILISGSVSLLGLKEETFVSITEKGFNFSLEGKIFNLFEAELDISATHFKSGADIHLKAKMKNDMLTYLEEHAIDVIKDGADGANGKIEDAQNKVDSAQSQVDYIQNEIIKMRNKIKKERQRDAKRVTDATDLVTQGQKKVNGLDQDIKNMRNHIISETKRSTSKISDAQKSVDSANKTVADLQKQINRSKATIKKLQAQIKKKNKWYKKAKWYQKASRLAKYTAYAASKGAQIAVQELEIGGLETAKATAYASLEVAKTFLQTAKDAAKSYPVDADPRVVSLVVAKDAASVGLTVARKALQTLEDVIKSFPIDADLRVVSLIASKEVVVTALKVAKDFLEAMNTSLKGIAAAGEFIVKYGLGSVLDVKEATFEADLNVVNGGNVSMKLDTILMKQEMRLSFMMDFNNPLDSVKILGQQLLKKIHSLSI